MNIYSKPGTRVRFTNQNGREVERSEAGELLGTDSVWTVKSVEVHNWISYVEFQELPGERFNTVMFTEVQDDHPG